MQYYMHVVWVIDLVQFSIAINRTGTAVLYVTYAYYA